MVVYLPSIRSRRPMTVTPQTAKSHAPRYMYRIHSASSNVHVSTFSMLVGIVGAQRSEIRKWYYQLGRVCSPPMTRELVELNFTE
jgi:hypothetical protein